MPLSHGELIKIVESLGYFTNEKGLCYAISTMADMAITLGKFNDFVNRLQFMSDLIGEDKTQQDRFEYIKSKGLKIEIQKAKDKVKEISQQLRDTSLSQITKDQIQQELENCKKIIEIQAFCQNISVIFLPVDYERENKDLFAQAIPGKFRKAQDDKTLDILLPVVRSTELENRGSMQFVFNSKLKKLGQNRVSKLNGYFWVLSQIFSEIRQKAEEMKVAAGVSIAIGGPNHAISGTFDSVKNTVILVDPNRLPYSRTPLHRVGDTLAGYGDPIFFSKFMNKDSMNDQSIYFNFKTTGDQAPFVKEIFSKYDGELELCNQGWLPAHFAAKHNDINMISTLKEKKENFIAANDKGETPVDIAAKMQNWSVLAYFLLNVNDAKYIQSENFQMINFDRQELAKSFYKIIDSKESIEDKFDILTSIVNQQNALGFVLMSKEDEISLEIKKLFAIQKDQMAKQGRLLGEKKLTHEDQLVNLANALNAEKKLTDNFQVDCLVDKKESEKIFTLVMHGLFSESPVSKDSARKICNSWQFLSEEKSNDGTQKMINKNLYDLLGDDSNLLQEFKKNGLAQAIEYHIIATVASIYDSVKEKKELSLTAKQQAICNFLFEPEHLKSFLQVLSHRKSQSDDMPDLIKKSYKALNYLYDVNDKMEDAFEKVWAKNPTAIDWLSQGISLSYTVEKLFKPENTATPAQQGVQKRY